jgi:hypothetical protein
MSDVAAPVVPAEVEAPVTADAAEGDEMAAALAAVEAEEGEAPKGAAPVEKKDGEEEQPPEGHAAKGWAAVRRREEKLRAQKEAFKQERLQVDSRLKEMDAKLAQLKEREDALVADPLAYLSKQGTTFDDLARRVLGDGKPAPEEQARRQALTMEQKFKEQEERQARLEAYIHKQETSSLINNYRADISKTLASSEFELLAAWPDAEEEVLQFADKWASQRREVLTPSQAAAKLQGELQKQLERLGSHQAVRKFFTDSKQAVSGQSQAPRGNGASSPKTLTNNLAATPPASDPDWDSLSDEDQIQAALRLVQDG